MKEAEQEGKLLAAAIAAVLAEASKGEVLLPSSQRGGGRGGGEGGRGRAQARGEGGGGGGGGGGRGERRG